MLFKLELVFSECLVSRWPHTPGDYPNSRAPGWPPAQSDRNVRMLDAERGVFTGAAMPEVSATAKSLFIKIPFHALELLINAEVIPCLLAPGLHQHKGVRPSLASAFEP